jgi:thioredoxin-like negative regulator of GroEL
VFESAAEKFPAVGFGKYEITDGNRTAATEYNVRSIPCIIAFKDGAPVGQKNGLTDEEMFTEWIKGFLS